VGYVGTTDITERKQAEDRILKKDYSETIINNLPGIFYLYDESGNFKMESNLLVGIIGINR
jgi:PAS domain-containing protein